MSFILITREQYNEARAKLPDPETYPHSCIDVGVDSTPIYERFTIDEEPAPGDYVVMFDRLTLDGSPSVHGLSQAFWKLASYYRVIE